jgi:hypothetical protein
LALRIGVPTLQAVFTGDLGGDPQGWPALLEQSGITLRWRWWSRHEGRRESRGLGCCCSKSF